MLLAATTYLFSQGPPSGAVLARPFFDPATFSCSSVSAGTSLAVLTYIGFDGISTLGEEVKDARRNILRGTVLVCLIIGVLSAVESYAAQLVWPYGEALPNLDTAYVHIAGRAGGPWLFQAINLTLILATLGSGSGGVLAGARLMYGMGREGALLNAFFGQLSPRTGVPSQNVMLIGALALLGSFALTYQRGAELLNFGAFIGFVGVNLSALLRFGIRARSGLLSILAPLAGSLICGFLWWNLPTGSKQLGAAWLAVGILSYFLFARHRIRS
jgi:amino acid transporter